MSPQKVSRKAKRKFNKETPGVREVILASYFNLGKEIPLTAWDYEKYLKLKDLGDRKRNIAHLIFHRLHGRYLRPFLFLSDTYKREFKNGFSVMANCCLLIETLQSFKEGWQDTKGKDLEAFVNFFKNNSDFNAFENRGEEFYKKIRCGILHQGETYDGWKICRKDDAPLCNWNGRVINAHKFARKLEESLKNYRDQLENKEWDSELWDNLRRKMRAIIKNSK